VTRIRKTQDELEQPAKVYQLDAVESKVDIVLVKLDELSQKTSGLVTQTQLETRMSDEVQKIHLEYQPMKKNLSRFTWLAVGEGVAIVGQVILLWIISKGG